VHDRARDPALELDADVDDRQRILSRDTRNKRPAIRKLVTSPSRPSERMASRTGRRLTPKRGARSTSDTLTWREPSAEDVCAQRFRDVVAK
jgi:hypothetical protein